MTTCETIQDKLGTTWHNTIIRLDSNSIEFEQVLRQPPPRSTEHHTSNSGNNNSNNLNITSTSVCTPIVSTETQIVITRRYCWTSRFCTSWDASKTAINGMWTLPTGAKLVHPTTAFVSMFSCQIIWNHAGVVLLVSGTCLIISFNSPRRFRKPSKG